MKNLQNNLSQISSAIPDWPREKKRLFESSPSKSLLKSIGDYQRCKSSKNIINFYIFGRFSQIRHIFWCVMTGADIPLSTRISGGLLMLHPNGVVISPDAVIGPNCLIFQQVTIGSRNSGVPMIGSHVLIGANAVVLTDIPDGKTAVGIPAKVIN